MCSKFLQLFTCAFVHVNLGIAHAIAKKETSELNILSNKNGDIEMTTKVRRQDFTNFIATHRSKIETGL